MILDVIFVRHIVKKEIGLRTINKRECAENNKRECAEKTNKNAQEITNENTPKEEGKYDRLHRRTQKPNG